MTDKRKDKNTYVFDEMVSAGWDDREFLTEEDVCQRWQMEPGRKIRNLIQGRNARGLRLPVFRIGNKTRRFRPSDVLEFEYEVLEV